MNFQLVIKKRYLFQTELTVQRIQEFETQASSDLEVRNNKIEELTRANEELRHQVSAQQKTIDQHKQHITKCIDVVKKLLMEKSSIEKKEARQRCMQNRLRLGQFVTQRVGATFQENWTDGHAFQELARFVRPIKKKCLNLKQKFSYPVSFFLVKSVDVFSCWVDILVWMRCVFSVPGGKRR